MLYSTPVMEKRLLEVDQPLHQATASTGRIISAVNLASEDGSPQGV